MDARNWHRQATRRLPCPPDPVSGGELRLMSAGARQEYLTRVRASLRLKPLASPIHDEISAQMTLELESALLEPPGARTILSLSAPFAAGKSTLVKQWAQHLHRDWLGVSDVVEEPAGELPQWVPKPGYLAGVIPVNYMTLLSDSRGIDLYAQLLAFASLEAGARTRASALVQQAVEALARHRTRMVIIDDAHMLRTTSVTGRATLNAVKHLNTELGEIGGALVLVGANLTGGDVLEDDQIRARLAQHAFDAYEIDTVDGRQQWQRFMKTCESRLLPYLPRNQAGDFSQLHSTYIWVRTQGYVSDVAALLIGATTAALGSDARIDRNLLGGISLSQRARDGERLALGRLRKPRSTASSKAAG